VLASNLERKPTASATAAMSAAAPVR